MLDFFRKYQRYFFIVIAIIIIASFSFFGTYSTMQTPQKIEDKPLGQAVDGSKMMKNEIAQLTHFLWSDRFDLQLAEKRVMPNFFNDGVIRKDLLGSGLGVMLAQNYFEALESDLNYRLEKHKQFRPYQHPTALFISAENLWNQVLPAQKNNLMRFKNDISKVDLEMFSLLVDLYLGETAFPPNILREYLLFQQKHYNWVQPDPNLPTTNLNLFYCTSLEDWFGPRFVELCAQFIHNASLLAKSKGYKVSYEEARVDLVRNGYESLQMQKRKAEVSEEELSSLLQQQLYALGMDEKSAVHVWQKVMLFRRLFQDYGKAVFLDPHLYQTFHGYASKMAELDFYHLPESLEFKDFYGFLKLQFYLEAVSSNSRELQLPRVFKRVETIENAHPELIEQRFLVEMADIDINEVALNVSLKAMWEWQVEPENFQVLEKEFPELALKKSEDAEGYYNALEGLSPDIRRQVDLFSRRQIAKLHPEWIQEALDQKHLVKRELSISPDGKNLSLAGLEGCEDLSKLLKKAALRDQLEGNKNKALKARKELELFSSDAVTYYRFHLLDRDLTKQVLTFAEADERGILDRLLDQKLEKEYSSLRSKHASLFKTEKDEWKPFEEVKGLVGRLLYSDFLKEIDETCLLSGIELKQERLENLDTFYPKYCLFAYMQTAERDIRAKRDQSVFLQQTMIEEREDSLCQKPPLEEQWSLRKEAKVFKNHEKNPYFTADVFAMLEKSWSSVEENLSGTLSFFELKEKAVPSGDFSQEIKQGQDILSKEAQRFYMTEVLDALKEADAIHLPVAEEAKGA